MNTVTVNASRSYEVKIGPGLLSQLGAEAATVGAKGVAVIISDSNVWSLYGSTAENSLVRAGFSVLSYVFPAGEQQKNAATYLDLLTFLATNRVTRSDCLVALGGGVVGDLTGCAAATYLRGIGYIQVPTTLLAAVDSSVGGKTAIDLEVGKNLVGAFCQPKLVLCDTDTLDTLPQNIFRDGCAEVIKYGILYDPEMFALLLKTGMDFPREKIITRCVELKRDVVAEDEFDTGCRMKLNLGHTIGHSIENAAAMAFLTDTLWQRALQSSPGAPQPRASVPQKPCKAFWTFLHGLDLMPIPNIRQTHFWMLHCPTKNAPAVSSS